MPRLAGRLWWSFYEADAGFENFLNNALAYVCRQEPEEVRGLSWEQKANSLLQILDREPHLFVLDGFERAMIAYHRMDAAHLPDDELDEETANRVAGAHGLPLSAGQSFVGKHRLRQTTDPRAGQFLRALTKVRAARILITTRLYPSELQLPTGNAIPGSFAAFLPGLSEDDAMGLWRALDVSGSRTELRPIFQSVEGHPLLIQALASEVATYRKAPGDFAQWRADHPDFDPTGLPLQRSRTHILAFALDGLTPELRQVVETIVAFRMPTSYETLSALLIGEDRPCADGKALDEALTDLEDRGLIGWDRIENRYDAHPIVRGVVWNLAGADDQKSVLAALETHFEPMETPSDYTKVESLAELAPAIERFNTLIGLGRYDDAFRLFRDRLEYATLFRLAAHRERIEWLERLFPDGVDAPPALSDDRDAAHTLNALALSYQYCGAPGRAAPLYGRGAENSERREDGSALAITLANLGECLTQSGGFREAEAVLRRALVLNRAAKEAFEGAIQLYYLGRLVAQMGDAARSQEALQRSLRMFEKRNETQSQAVVTAYLAERAILFGDAKEAELDANEAWRLAGYQRLERDFIAAAVHQGQAALGLGNLDVAEERLHHALTRARAVNVVEEELPALVTLAKLALAKGDAGLARQHLDDVWDAAERGPYPIRQADAFNVLAEIERVEGNTPAAIEAATQAYKAAWCDGPPWAYHWGLEAAKAHLAELGAEEPDLPTFDESKFEPLPDVPITPEGDDKD
ncbi:MAG: hypothetical protein AAGD13_23115 [Pseudomonadota bacterium]